MISPEHFQKEEAPQRSKSSLPVEAEAANDEVFPVELANKLFESRAIIDSFNKEAGQIGKLKEIRVFLEKILKNLENQNWGEEIKKDDITEKRMKEIKELKAVKISIEAEIKEINKLI